MPPQIPYRPGGVENRVAQNKWLRTSGSDLCREPGGSAFGQLALRGLLSARNTPQAPASLGQPAAWSALAGHIGPCFRPRHRPQAPLSKAPDSSHSASARSSARSMSTSHAASVAASAPARTHADEAAGRNRPNRLGSWSLACVRSVWSAGRLEFRGALPALAPQHGTVARSTRLESEVIAPACHQKKMPPPGNTSRAGSRMGRHQTPPPARNLRAQTSVRALLASNNACNSKGDWAQRWSSPSA